MLKLLIKCEVEDSWWIMVQYIGEHLHAFISIHRERIQCSTAGLVTVEVLSTR